MKVPARLIAAVQEETHFAANVGETEIRYCEECSERDNAGHSHPYAHGDMGYSFGHTTDRDIQQAEIWADMSARVTETMNRRVQAF